VFFGCRAVAPHMMERGYGKIINISSIAASMAFKMEAVYGASKAAVNMLTRTLALEWAAYGVRVNALAPGDYNTAMTAEAWSDPVRRQVYLDSIPLGTEGDMVGLGALAVFLASTDSDYITGQTIYIDGGLTAQ
jgi:NAD(P)-dependent dehydrogenase (short-subunit alcohol dehydrogenase family)